jgi:phosphatidylglycerophosphate synthase
MAAAVVALSTAAVQTRLLVLAVLVAVVVEHTLPALLTILLAVLEVLVVVVAARLLRETTSFREVLEETVVAGARVGARAAAPLIILAVEVAMVLLYFTGQKGTKNEIRMDSRQQNS